MKKNQNGFSAVGILLVVVVLGLIGGTGWYVWQKQDKNDAVTKTSSQISEDKAKTQETKKETNLTTIDVNISLKTAADISKLPSSIPESFKTYLLGKLKANTPDTLGCIVLYSVSKISAVNIKGGGAAVSATGNDNSECIGGAPLVWVLTPAGKWDEVSLNTAVCKSENGGLIYEEFAAECYTNPNTESLVKNPNGSVTALTQ